MHCYNAMNFPRKYYATTLRNKLGFAKAKRGFTLIELLVVISIIALLSSVVLSSLNKVQAKARDAQRIQDLQQIQKALILYYDDYGHYPTLGNPTINIIYSSTWGILSNFLKNYISIVPKDPVKGADGVPPFASAGPVSGYIYYTNPDGSKYQLMGRLETSNPVSCSNNNYEEIKGVRVFGALFTYGYNNYYCPSWTSANDNLYVISGY